MSDVRDALDQAERAVQWLAWPGERPYGPGLTAAEVGERHSQYLRSGWSRSSSDAYHRVRVAPRELPPAPWPEHYPHAVTGADPWV